MSEKVSARGVAIKCFVALIPGLQDKTLSAEAFRKQVTADIAEKLSMPVDECGYLYNKARRATERSGKYPDVDFGAAKRAEPVAKPVTPAATTEGGEGTTEGTTQGTVVAQAETGERKDLETFTILLVEEGKVTKSYSYGNKGVAKMQFGARTKKGGDWKFIQGMGPEVGQDYALAEGESEITV